MNHIWLMWITKHPRSPPMKQFPQKGIEEEGDDDPLSREAQRAY